MRILYFARLREIIGKGQEELAPPADTANVSALADWLSGQSERHREVFSERKGIRVAIDQNICDWNSSVAEAQEVAFFPPVTGG